MQQRFRIGFWLFTIALITIFVRFVFLEGTYGAAFRELAAQPIRKRQSIRAPRGRILTTDRQVLAAERIALFVTVRFQYLESPPNPAWLDIRVRKRLTKRERQDSRRIAEEDTRFRGELSEMHRRLATLCEIPISDWNRRRRQIQARVGRIADLVNRRARLKEDSSPTAPRIVITEERSGHRIALIRKEAAEQITSHPERFPGVTIEERPRRFYPKGTLAAHLVGHLGAVGKAELIQDDSLRPGDRIGRLGIERQYDEVLRGRPGVLLRTTDHRGRLLSQETSEAMAPGRDLRLTLHGDLQKTAEILLDDALARRDAMYSAQGGGAVVVMDVETGAILVAASAPRFDPNVFEEGDATKIGESTRRPDAPLFDRVTRMQSSPGSVFKVVTAAALLEEGVVEPESPFECRGYLHDPSALRCAIFTRRGVGHGTINLYDALAQSCNVYFFHHVESLGCVPLTEWANRFGLGLPTGIDLPSEASGNVSLNSDEITALRLAAVGQGPVTATPLQIARMIAAVANGGRLVVPHVVDPDSLDEAAELRLASRPIPALHSRTLDILHDALHMVVSTPEGTAYAVLHNAAVPLSAKTGTAETAGGPAHAWLAAYAPVNSPRYAVVVALEHAGNAAETAGPVVERLTRALKKEL